MSYVNKRGQVCRSAAEKRVLLEEYHRSGESPSSFSSRRGLSLTTLHGWLNSEQNLKVKAEVAERSNRSKFIDVSIPETRAFSEKEDLRQNSFALSFRLGSILSLEYRRSSECPTA